MDERYENTAGERLGIIIVSSLYVLIVSVLSLGILLAPATNALYKQTFHHLKFNEKIGPIIPTLLYDTKRYFKLSWYVSLFIIFSSLILSVSFIAASHLVVYVLVYFIVFESLLYVVVSLPMMSVFKHQGVIIQAKKAMLIGHLHSSGTVFSIIIILLTLYFTPQLIIPWNVLVIVPISIIYFTVTSFIFYKIFLQYETSLNQSDT